MKNASYLIFLYNQPDNEFGVSHEQIEKALTTVSPQLENVLRSTFSPSDRRRTINGVLERLAEAEEATKRGAEKIPIDQVLDEYGSYVSRVENGSVPETDFEQWKQTTDVSGQVRQEINNNPAGFNNPVGGLVNSVGKQVFNTAVNKGLEKLGAAAATKLSGTAIGTALGSIVPGIGNLVGAAIGWLTVQLAKLLRNPKKATQKNHPSKLEVNELKIDIADDLYSELLQSVRWHKRKK